MFGDGEVRGPTVTNVRIVTSRSRFLLSTVAAAGAIGLPSSVIAKSERLSITGTLVTAVSTRDGLVIGADRRTNDFVQGDRDTTVKLTSIGRFIVVAGTGFSMFSQSAEHPEIIVYNASSIAAEYLRHRDLSRSVQSHLEPLGRMLISRLQQVLDPQAPPRLPDNSVLQLVLAHIDAVGRQSLHAVRIIYVPLRSGGSYFATTQSFADFPSGMPRLFGNTLGLEVLQSGDPRFERWRRDAAIMALHRAPRGSGNVTAQEAVEYVKAITRATAAIIPYVDTSSNHVGSTVDIGILKTHSGFHWLYRDKQESRVSAPAKR